MPPFQGMLSEEQVMQLIAYIKTLKAADGAGRSRQAQRSEVIYE